MPPRRPLATKHMKKKCRKVPDSSTQSADKNEENRVLYEVHLSDILGRYLVASQDIQPGQLILDEQPYMVGPIQDTKYVCIGCYKVLDRLNLTCPKCNWPLCSVKCRGNEASLHHSKEECQILSKIKEKPMEYDLAPYHALAPLRCLLLRTTNPSAIPVFSSLEHHNDSQREIPELWNFYKEEVVKRIIQDWNCQLFTEEEILKTCGSLDVNAFAIEREQARGLYPTGYLMSHDCVPNTYHCIGKDYSLKVIASTLIRKGDPITISYTDTLKDTTRRRAHLKAAKFFFCSCKRCIDPTELGTHLGAVKCPQCLMGFLYLENPSYEDSGWICASEDCKKTISARDVNRVVKDYEIKLSKLENTSISFLEFFITYSKNILHPNHFLLLSAQIRLSQMYGKMPGYFLDNMSIEQLQKKIEFCKKTIDILNVIEPGYSRLKGVTSYEMHAPLMVATQIQYKAKLIDKQQLARCLKEVVKLLQDTVEMLSFEEPPTPEGNIVIAAKEAIKGTKSWAPLIGQL